ncbi:arginine deiminase family protein [Cytobacillus spongiae]|uniref:arginine deiminase family protein n=1 Tax=Cytobacillus spongiae TaxID=2901381 RepID=UPI001F34DE1B|nr:arginine deiminase family protein [Cytobacillus spongiae]UII55497.1 arginine deiminase family protein [Cytobacillus spongiae]
MLIPIQPTCWSEHEELKTVVVCSPALLDVPDSETAQDIQWSKPFEYKKARENFDEMVTKMKDVGVEVIDYSDYLPMKDKKLSDQLIHRIFVRDLACTLGQTVIPGEPGMSMRRPEYMHAHFLFNRWLTEGTFKIEANNKIDSLECGDILVLNKNAVIINTGLRTSVSSIEHIKDHIFRAGFSEIGVINLPRRADTMHLDMNCNIVGNDVMLAKSYLRYFPVHVLTTGDASYQMMHEFLGRHGVEVIFTNHINHTVADINFISLDPETLLISSDANKKLFKHHPKLQNKKLIECDLTELEKGGGGIRCMTLPLVRG